MLQHQIVQSPARLGLTNPSSPSPSLQNPTPPRYPSSQQQSQQQQQQLLIHPNLHAPTASSTLLSLLPPLPRAQALLLQMASLSSKLFQVSPNRAHWLSAFRGSLPTFLTSQIQSNPPPPLESTPTSTKDIIALFTSLQTQLFEAVAQLQEILDLQDAKQKFAREIRGKDASLLSFANKLQEAEQVLDMLVDDYSDYRKPKRLKPEEEDDDSSSTTTVASQLNLSDILSYAHRISYTTFAPPEFGAGRGALPPAPQDEQMRASQLYAFADLDIGLPKEVETKEEKTVDPFTSLDADALAKLKALIPSGWKPGMPVQLENLPKDLFKDAPVFPPFPQESLPPPDMHRVSDARKSGEIIVKYVDLEVPDDDDDDDDESDYSSDEEPDDED